MGAHHFHVKFLPVGVRPVWNAQGEREGWLLAHHDISPAVATALRGLLPNPNHWGDCEEFGSNHDWGSDIRIFSEGGRIVEIGFRYSPGCDPVELLRSVVDLAKAAQCDLLVSSTRETVPADFEAVFDTLRKHRAFRFLSDPKAAIKEAANETEG
jgi:hypothetical protein